MEKFRLRNVGSVSGVNFDDVFGGPPRTLFLRHRDHSQFPDGVLLYAEIFADADDDFQPLSSPAEPPALDRGRNLPAFRIPGGHYGAVRRENGFYDDVFSLVDGRSSPVTSGWQSKSTSPSSLPPSMADDVALSTVASKLKPIIVRSQRHTDSCSEQNTHGNLTVASVGSYMECTDPSTDCYKHSTYIANFDRHYTSPLFQTYHPNQSTQSTKTPYDKSYYNREINSPSSVTTSTVHETETFVELPEKAFRDDECACEFAGNYMTQIVPQLVREDSNVVAAIDDAIAWAKEKYRTGVSKNLECETMTDGRNSFSSWREKPRGKKNGLHQAGVESCER